MCSDRWLLLGLTLLATNAVAAPAEPAEAGAVLEVIPSTCVSLSEGRTCYLDTHVHWQVASAAEHCLFVAGQRDPLSCTSNGRGDLDYPFSSDESEQLELRRADGELVATAEILVSWVYNGNQRRRGWRLF